MFLILFFIPVMILLWLFRDFFVIIGISIAWIISGLFGFSFDIIAELEGGICFLAIVFFPLTMLAGVGKAFQDIFYDVIPELTQ